MLTHRIYVLYLIVLAVHSLERSLYNIINDSIIILQKHSQEDFIHEESTFMQECPIYLRSTNIVSDDDFAVDICYRSMQRVHWMKVNLKHRHEEKTFVESLTSEQNTDCMITDMCIFSKAIAKHVQPNARTTDAAYFNLLGNTFYHTIPFTDPLHIAISPYSRGKWSEYLLSRPLKTFSIKNIFGKKKPHQKMECALLSHQKMSKTLFFSSRVSQMEKCFATVRKKIHQKKKKNDTIPWESRIADISQYILDKFGYFSPSYPLAPLLQGISDDGTLLQFSRFLSRSQYYAIAREESGGEKTPVRTVFSSQVAPFVKNLLSPPVRIRGSTPFDELSLYKPKLWHDFYSEELSRLVYFLDSFLTRLPLLNSSFTLSHQELAQVVKDKTPNQRTAMHADFFILGRSSPDLMAFRQGMQTLQERCERSHVSQVEEFLSAELLSSNMQADAKSEIYVASILTRVLLDVGSGFSVFGRDVGELRVLDDKIRADLSPSHSSSPTSLHPISPLVRKVQLSLEFKKSLIGEAERVINYYRDNYSTFSLVIKDWSLAAQKSFAQVMTHNVIRVLRVLRTEGERLGKKVALYAQHFLIGEIHHYTFFDAQLSEPLDTFEFLASCQEANDRPEWRVGGRGEKGGEKKRVTFKRSDTLESKRRKVEKRATLEATVLTESGEIHKVERREIGNREETQREGDGEGEREIKKEEISGEKEMLDEEKRWNEQAWHLDNWLLEKQRAPLTIFTKTFVGAGKAFERKNSRAKGGALKKTGEERQQVREREKQERREKRERRRQELAERSLGDSPEFFNVVDIIEGKNLTEYPEIVYFYQWFAIVLSHATSVFMKEKLMLMRDYFANRMENIKCFGEIERKRREKERERERDMITIPAHLDEMMEEEMSNHYDAQMRLAEERKLFGARTVYSPSKNRVFIAAGKFAELMYTIKNKIQLLGREGDMAFKFLTSPNVCVDMKNSPQSSWGDKKLMNALGQMSADVYGELFNAWKKLSSSNIPIALQTDVSSSAYPFKAKAANRKPRAKSSANDAKDTQGEKTNWGDENIIFPLSHMNLARTGSNFVDYTGESAESRPKTLKKSETNISDKNRTLTKKSTNSEEFYSLMSLPQLELHTRGSSIEHWQKKTEEGPERREESGDKRQESIEKGGKEERTEMREESGEIREEIEEIRGEIREIREESGGKGEVREEIVTEKEPMKGRERREAILIEAELQKLVSFSSDFVDSILVALKQIANNGEHLLALYEEGIAEAIPITETRFHDSSSDSCSGILFGVVQEGGEQFREQSSPHSPF